MCCQELVALFEPAGDVNLLAVLNVLKSVTALTVFDGTCNYENLRIARALAVMASKNFTDTPEEWQLCMAMSPHVAQEARDKAAGCGRTRAGGAGAYGGATMAASCGRAQV